MTTITIERRLLERLYLYWLEDADPHEQDEFRAQVRAALSAPATAPDSQEVKQIAEALRRIGMTLIRTGTGFKVMALGTTTAQEDKP